MDYSVDAFHTFMDLDSAIYYAAKSRFSNVRPVQARAKSVPGGGQWPRAASTKTKSRLRLHCRASSPAAQT